MPSLKSILKPEQTVDIFFGDVPVRVTYRPQYLTPEFEASLKGLADEDKASESFRVMFRKLVIKWDLKHSDDDPEAIPITEEGLAAIPYDVLGEIMSKVQEAILPNEPTGPTSDAGSLPAATSEASPTGTP